MEPVFGAWSRIEKVPSRFSSGSGTFSQVYATQTLPSFFAWAISALFATCMRSSKYCRCFRSLMAVSIPPVFFVSFSSNLLKYFPFIHIVILLILRFEFNLFCQFYDMCKIALSIFVESAKVLLTTEFFCQDI